MSKDPKRQPARRLVVGVVLVGVTAVLTACGDQQGSTTAATSSAPVTTDQLGDALLPATAFGSSATVVGLSLEQLGDLPSLAGLPQGGTVSPALCGTALSLVPKLAGSGDEVPTLVAEGAFTTGARTLEVLADGPALDGLTLPVDQLLASCSTVTVTATDGTATTVSLTALDVPDLGDTATGLQVTVTHPAGTVTGLVGVVSTGSRALVLARTGAAGAAPDQAGFSDLLTQAAAAARD